MAVTPAPLRRVPPPADIARDYPEFNRWLLDLIQFISTSGGINPVYVPGTVLNGNGAPAVGLGEDGQLYINNTGANNVIRTGLLADGSAVKDVTGTQLYAKIGGVWVAVQ